MFSRLPEIFTSTSAFLAISGAIAFVLSGGILIASGFRVGHEAIARRVDLVKPKAILVPKVKWRSLEKRVPGSHARGGSERDETEIIRRMSMLGIPAARASSVFIAVRAVMGGAFGGLLLIGMRQLAVLSNVPFATPLSVVVGATVGWLLPSILIGIAARQRAKAVASAMPEALDLLVVCVDAGLSLENALSRVVIELGRTRPALAEELAITSADLQISPGRDEALMRMADRVDVPSIRSVVTTLAQTLRYGTPLAQALRVIAAEMRDDALIRLEERANQLPALLTVPMMLFIMPTIFLVVGGPAALQLIDVLGHR